MQTYTHAAIGICIGAALFPGQPLAQLACVAGSVAPDLVMVPQYVLDTIRGRIPLGQQGPALLLLKNVSHSAPLWILVAAVAWYDIPFAQILFALGLGGLGHVVVDLFTHGNPQLNRQDSLYLWPMQQRPFNIGRWDYRLENGVLWPLRPFEAAVLVLCLAAALLLWLAY